MAPSETYLVPIDFSRGSERVLDYALTLARAKEKWSSRCMSLHLISRVNVPCDSGLQDGLLKNSMSRSAPQRLQILGLRRAVRTGAFLNTVAINIFMICSFKGFDLPPNERRRCHIAKISSKHPKLAINPIVRFAKMASVDRPLSVEISPKVSRFDQVCTRI
jgi:hypothetical protein